MCAEGDAELAEAFEDGKVAGRAEASCECPHRSDCALAEKPPWWRRWLDTVTS